MVDGIPSSWKDGLAGLSAAYNALSGVGSAVAGGLEAASNAFNSLTTVTPSDTFTASNGSNTSGNSGIRPNGLNPSPTSSVSQSSGADSVVGNSAAMGNVDQQVYAAANQAFQNYGSGTKGVSDGKCFPVAKEAWLNLYKTDLTGYHAGDKSHRGKSVNELANILPSSRPGTVMYLNNSPGADPSSMDMSLKPHWAVYAGGGRIVDNWANNWSIPEFIKKFGDGRLIDEIMPPPNA